MEPVAAAAAALGPEEQVNTNITDNNDVEIITGTSVPWYQGLGTAQLLARGSNKWNNEIWRCYHATTHMVVRNKVPQRLNEQTK